MKKQAIVMAAVASFLGGILMAQEQPQTSARKPADLVEQLADVLEAGLDSVSPRKQVDYLGLYEFLHTHVPSPEHLYVDVFSSYGLRVAHFFVPERTELLKGDLKLVWEGGVDLDGERGSTSVALINCRKLPESSGSLSDEQYVDALKNAAVPVTSTPEFRLALVQAVQRVAFRKTVRKSKELIQSCGLTGNCPE